MGPRGGHWFCFFCISPVLIYPPAVSTSAATCYVSAVGSDSGVVAGDLTRVELLCSPLCAGGIARHSAPLWLPFAATAEHNPQWITTG